MLPGPRAKSRAPIGWTQSGGSGADAGWPLALPEVPTVHLVASAPVRRGIEPPMLRSALPLWPLFRPAALLASLGAAAGCGDDPPPPEEFAIVEFVAEPERVAVGQRAVLMWEVRGAERLRVFDERGDTLAEGDPPETTGSVVSPAVTGRARFTLEISRSVDAPLRRTVEVRVQLPDPVFVEAEVIPSQILAGQGAALRWRTENALAVDIRTSTGAVVLEAGLEEGQQVVRPRVSTTYELTARGVDGNATTTLAVRVGNRPPSIERFSAVPPQVVAGAPMTLTWQVLGADRIRVRGLDGTGPVYDGTREQGSEILRPTAAERFVLTADGPGGSRSATVAISVRAPEALGIDRLLVEPNPSARGEPAELSWTVRGATGVSIEQDGAVIQPNAAATGRLPVLFSEDETTLRLVAEGGGEQRARSVVAHVHDTPELDPLSVEPPAAAAATPRTVRYAARNVLQLGLFAGGRPVLGFSALTATTGPQRDVTGSVSVTATVTSVVRLDGASAAGAETQEALLVVGRAEVEPNDSAATALPPPPIGTTEDYLGTAPPPDVDVFAIDVADGASVSARVGAGPGRCGPDAQIGLRDGNGALLASASGACARIGPETHAGAGILEAGRHFVEIRAQSAAPYVLTLGPGAQTCGDGVRQPPEQCDDGDRAAGDGCDARCQLEPRVSLSPPGGSVDFGTLSSTSAATVRVVLDQPGQSITATAAAPSGRCDGARTVVALLDGTGGVRVERASGGPTGTAGDCGGIDPFADRAAADLAPGTYFVRVRSDGGGPVRLGVTVSNPACGNGLLESRAGEQCDDGNQVSGDGCSATCQIEGGALPEREPNDRQADANFTGLRGPGSVQIRGEIRPSGDDDVFAVEVPAGQNLRLFARTYTVSGQPLSCDGALTDTRIFVEREGVEATGPGTGEIAFNDDIDTARNVWCSELRGVFLVGGPSGATYYLRVQGWQDRGTASYFLDLRLLR